MNDFQISTLAAAVAVAIVVPVLFGMVGDRPAKKRENFVTACIGIFALYAVIAVFILLASGVEWLIRFFMGGAA